MTEQWGLAPPRVLGINGIRNNGEHNTDRAIRHLAFLLGSEAVDCHYPLTNLLRARSRKAQYADARLLMREYYQPEDVVVAHSRGCLVSLRMMELGARFSTVFWFRPAMNRDFIIPKGACDRLVCIHHPDDHAIRLGSLLWWHDFGKAGSHGLYTGIRGHELDDERVINIQSPDYYEHEFWHHSCDFQPEVNLAESISLMEAILCHGHIR